MNHKMEKDEYIERLYNMKEHRKDSINDLKNAINGNFDVAIIDELLSEDMIDLKQEENKIFLTKKGVNYAQRIIRAHRIAERLIFDVLGGEFESGACEFEHLVSPELVDSICILLGHPRECPHGMPIPAGECCKHSTRTAESLVSPLSELKVGHSARVAYVNCPNEKQHHKIDGLQIRPRVLVKLEQIYPSYVIECEGVNIALDQEIVSNIFVWKKSTDILTQLQELPRGNQSDMIESV